MAQKTIGGISGVLGDLISSAPTPAALPRLEESPAGGRKASPLDTPNPLPTPRLRPARLGRPSDSGPRPTGPKEKVTLRLTSHLIAEYRDWSWEARCQLSGLVERALITYRESHRRQQ
jgi:hypothetical protein